MNCENCQVETILTEVKKYRYSESGLENVFLDNIKTYNCGECGIQIPVIPKILKLHNTIAYAIVCKPELLNGAELKFLRKNAGVKSQDWAKLLRTDKSVYSRWESDNQPIGSQSDLLLRYLYLRLLEEKKGLHLQEDIAEKLAILSNEKIAIVINVEQVERYEYLPLSEAVRLLEDQHPYIAKFDIELDDSNNYFGEIEQPLSFGAVVNLADYPRAANQELALAA
jgi:DNA-binding transcriptional regulator YiaG